VDLGIKEVEMFRGIGKVAIIGAFLFSLTVAFGADIYVPDNYPTIQAAIDAANPGDRVIVRAGSYWETIVINKSITVQGESGAIIEAGGLTGNAVTVTADNVTIKGFTINNAYVHGIYAANVNNLTIMDNTIASSGTHGVFIVNGTNVELTHNVITGHTRYAAVLFWGGSNCTIKRNYVHDNIAGIAVGRYSSTDPIPQNFTIVNNTVTNNTHPTSGFGIWIAGQNISIRANDVKNNSVGIYMYDQPFTTAPSSALTDITSVILPLQELQAAGIGPEGPAPSNQILFAATGNTVYYNDIAGNARAGLANGASDTIDARYNWWGAADGPSYDGPGSGDKVSYEGHPANVNFSPWLRVAASLKNTTVGVLDPSNANFFLRSTNDSGPGDITFNYGIPNWIPIVGDWDGDGVDTVGVYDPVTATFYLRNTNTAGFADITFVYGAPNWIPIAGDWNGDGVDTIGVYDPVTATFYLRNTNTTGVADIAFVYGMPNWTPIAGDWDGDGVDTVGVYDPTTATFYLRNSNTAGFADIAFVYGAPNWTPIAGNWDGSGGVGSFTLSSASALALTDSPAPLSLQVMCSPNPVREAHEVTFQVLASAEVQAIRVTVFDLAGQLVWQDQAQGNQLVWHTQNLAGEYLANGVYLYQVQVKVENHWITTQVKKLLILR
jgi:cell wall assembly regulator SMI1